MNEAGMARDPKPFVYIVTRRCFDDAKHIAICDKPSPAYRIMVDDHSRSGCEGFLIKTPLEGKQPNRIQCSDEDCAGYIVSPVTLNEFSRF